MKQVEAFFDTDTSTLTYVVYDPATKDAVIFDPVLNYDPASSTYWHDSIKLVEDFVKTHGLKVHYVIDTHAHADHLTGTPDLLKIFPGAKSVIGQHITEVQKTFFTMLNMTELAQDGSQFDILLGDGDILEAGSITLKAIHTPGHTPTCTSYHIDDMVFTGDALFMPDFGTGRCDFPKGSAQQLYHSIAKKLYQLPDETRVFVGHDYQPGGRDLAWETTIGASKKTNIHLKASTSEEEFVAFRTQRDQTLNAPRLLLPSIQVNVNGGAFPPAEENQMSYLKLPLRKK
jgi:glyoxylase-like metal-dependent hydrolase (beta-lactamase superfamily II)